MLTYLTAGRRVLWDDVSRRVAVLVTAPAAFEAEHFTQVSSGHVILFRDDQAL